MNTEFEATFYRIDTELLRTKLTDAGAEIHFPQTTMRRWVCDIGGENGRDFDFVRIRDEGSKITLTFKTFTDEKSINRQKEIELVVDDFDTAYEFCCAIGLEPKSYQVTKREIWLLDGVEVTIDFWPFLEPIMEIEGKTEDEVKRVTKMLGLDYEEAVFDAIGYFYIKEYNQDPIEFPRLDFEMENPFIKNN